MTREVEHVFPFYTILQRSLLLQSENVFCWFAPWTKNSTHFFLLLLFSVRKWSPLQLKILPYIDFMEEFLLESHIDNRPQNPAPTRYITKLLYCSEVSLFFVFFLFEMWYYSSVAVAVTMKNSALLFFFFGLFCCWNLAFDYSINIFLFYFRGGFFLFCFVCV